MRKTRNERIGRRGESRPAQRAFTLVEMLIVIGIIALLASLTLAVTRSFTEQSEIRETKIILRLLDASVREWVMTSERTLRWWDSRDKQEYRPLADMHDDTPDIFLISEMLEVIRRSRDSKAILTQIAPDYMHTYKAGQVPNWISYQDQYSYGSFVDTLTILDAWDTPIYATHPGRVWHNADAEEFGPSDEDGTVRTLNETRYGIAPGRQIVFISAGPDGRFGIPQEFPLLYGPSRDEAMKEARLDNLATVRVSYPASY